MKEKNEIELRSNNTRTHDQCAICSGYIEPAIPIWAFVRDTFDPICQVCLREHRPDFAQLLGAFYHNDKNIGSFMGADNSWLKNSVLDVLDVGKNNMEYS